MKINKNKKRFNRQCSVIYIKTGFFFILTIHLSGIYSVKNKQTKTCFIAGILQRIWYFVMCAFMWSERKGLKMCLLGAPVQDQQKVIWPVSTHEDACSIPGIRSGIWHAMSCVVDSARILCYCGCGVGRQLQLRFDSFPGNFPMPWVWTKKKMCLWV